MFPALHVNVAQPSTAPSTPGTQEVSSTAGLGAAAYTLLGVAVTAIVSLIAIYVKYKLDERSEKVKHAREMAKMEAQLSEERKERSKIETRKVYGEFLAGLAEIYQIINNARRKRRQDQDDAAYRETLRKISPGRCQVALEEGFLVANIDTAEIAQKVWHHTRSHDVPNGNNLSSDEWANWKEEYWKIRQELVTSLRKEIFPE